VVRLAAEHRPVPAPLQQIRPPFEGDERKAEQFCLFVADGGGGAIPHVLLYSKA
jgi:hypothetical protein